MTETLARVVYARETLEAGDVGLVAAILHDLETDLAGGRVRNACTPSHEWWRVRLACPDCSASFRWPGELVDHRDNVHWRAA